MKKAQIFFLFIALLSFCVQAQNEARDLEQKVNRYVQWMVREEKPEVWDGASRLKELGPQAVPIIKKLISTLPEMGQVGCAKALIDLNELDYSLNILMTIVEKGTNPKARMNALGLIGTNGSFEMEEKLEKVMETSVEPYTKIALAKTLWQVARNPKASKVLKELLQVDNIKIQQEAALALGEIGNVETAKPILNQLKDEPSERGRLAKILLEKESLLRLLDSQGTTKKNAGNNQANASKYPLIDEVIHKIKEFHVDGDKIGTLELLNSAVRGMVGSTDLHSAFWTEQEWNDFVKATIDEEYVGIGIYVGDREGHFTVIAPIYSGPAYKAGIRSMDRIVEVNGWSTTGKAVDDIVQRIKGESGTSVTLKVYRTGWSKVREVIIPREKIKVPSVFAQMLPMGIGYLRLTQFGKKATDDMEEALRELSKNNMKALVFDLRGNAGGWLATAVDVVDKYMEEGKLIVYSEGRHPEKGKKTEHYSSRGTKYINFPMVILVDQSSASASEIVAGALQHYKRAILVGMQTFGKGSVQEPLSLETRPGAKLKLTIAKYFLPDGRCIHNDMDKDGKVLKQNGIMPDIKVEYEDWEPWKNEEQGKLEEAKAFEKYLEKNYEANKELFVKLADNDSLDYEKYPGFEEWYKSLNTRATQKDVRFWLRAKIRRLVADERGRDYACDYLEDVMLQRAIVELCKKQKVDLQAVPEYKVFSEKFNK